MISQTITWALPSTSRLALAWTPFPDPASATPIAENWDLDRRLGLPGGTIQILNQALALNLPRTTGWEYPVADVRVASAAKLYRRGVALKCAGQVIEDDPRHGSYAVDIVESGRPTFLSDLRDSFFIVDKNVAKLWPQLAQDGIEAFVLQVSEQEKTLSSVAKIIDAARNHPSRHWVIIGGGALCDVAAFAASLFSSSFTLVPTTLLAMVDATIGGKSGVNVPPYGKNQIGAFAFPRQVLLWTAWLETLPEREWRSGLTEALKHAFLVGKKVFAIAVATLDRQNLSALPNILPQLIKVKAHIVQRDPLELGCRASLNFGHTLGHALEAASQKYSPDDHLTHGEAVAMGMVFAARLSVKHCGMPSDEYEFMKDMLVRAKCLPEADRFRASFAGRKPASLLQELLSLITFDKKNDDDASRSRWVLLNRLGDPWKSGDQYTNILDTASVQESLTRFLDELSG